MGPIVLLALAVLVYWLIRRVRSRFTDAETRRNQAHLGRMLLIAAGLFFVLLMWIALSNQH